MRKYLVYKVTFPNNKVYIGITSKDLEFRKKKHFSELKKGTNYKFHNALRKYEGLEVWEEFAYAFTWDACKELEQKLIKYFNSFDNGYNSTLGGDGTLGWKHNPNSVKKSKEHRDKIRIALKGKPKSKKAKESMSKSRKNFKYSREQKEQQAINCGGKLFTVFKNNIELGKWYSKQVCAKELQLNARGILGCLNQPNKFKSHKGYTFRYVGEKHA